jgi:hypothetical protein
LTETLVEETTSPETYVKVPRTELVIQLRARDGDVCQHPDCGNRMNFSITDGPLEVTIDHWIPQIFGKENGWTMAEIWALGNLKLMHKKCNAKKGDLIPNEDGSLPDKPSSTFKFRRHKRAERPEVCTSCNSGRDLGPGQVCSSCSSGPQPERFPRWAKVDSRECDHELFWCWACSIGIHERPSSVGIAMRQADTDELGELITV